MMLGIMWMFQVIAFILVGFRLYTRLVVVHNYGIDDHFFNFTVVSTFHLYESLPMMSSPSPSSVPVGIFDGHRQPSEEHRLMLSGTCQFCLLVYVTLVTVAARYGLGQEMTNPASEETSRALLLVNIGQSVTTIAAVTIKISIACFLLRIVGVNRTHQVAIILPVTLVALSVFIALWLLWFSCKPVSYSWDITVPGGHCDAVTQFWAGLVSGVMIVVVELWYASFPWYLIRGLQMPRREKILIGTSMSVSYM